MQESFGKRIWRLFYPMITYTGVSYFVTYLFMSGCMIICILDKSIDMMHMTMDMFNTVEEVYSNYINESNAVIFAITIPLFILYMHMDKRRKIKYGVYKQEKQTAWYKYIILPILGIAACVGGTFMIILGGWELTGMNSLNDALFSGKTVIELISLGILYPIMNELLYRGLLYNRLKEYMTKHMAALMISLVIAFYSNNFAEGIYSFLMSVLCIYVYDRYHSVLAPILVSMGASIITVLEKEKNILSGLYNSWSGFVTATVVLCIVVIISILVIEKLVYVNDSVTESVSEEE